MAIKDEVYENAPLKETVFEIRFPGNPAVECKKDKFYEKIKNLYPDVLVPRISDKKAPALEPYRFQHINGLCGIMVAINKIAFYCKDYKGFKIFKKEVLRIFTIFNQLFKITNINRVGLRYVNIIPFTREAGSIPLNNYLNIKVDLNNFKNDEFNQLSLLLTNPVKDGIITTRIQNMLSSDKIKEAILLDFDYSKDANLKFNFISKYLDESHQHTKELFENLITENYKTYMRGDKI